MDQSSRFPKIQVRTCQTGGKGEPSLLRTNTQSTAQLPTVKNSIKRANSQIDVVSSITGDVQATAEVARGKILQLERLRHENEDLRQKLEQATAQNIKSIAEFDQQLAVVQRERNDLQTKCERLSAELGQSQGQFQQIDSYNKRLRTESNSLYYENGLLRAALSEAARTFADYQAKFNSIMTEMTVLYRKLERSNALCEELEQENKQLVGRQSMKLNLPENQRLSDANASIERLKQQVQDLNDELRATNVKLAQAQQDAVEKSELKRQIQELKASEKKCLDIIKSNIMIMSTMRAQK